MNRKNPKIIHCQQNEKISAKVSLEFQNDQKTLKSKKKINVNHDPKMSISKIKG